MLVSCPHVKLECQHCFHFVPHDRVRMCKNGICPVTFKRCVCSEEPVKIDLSKHLSTSRGEFK
jgi:hypothetical protein